MTTDAMIAAIRARREALAAQLEQGKAQYAQMEQALALLQRNLDAMHGGLQELSALLEPPDTAEAPPKRRANNKKGPGSGVSRSGALLVKEINRAVDIGLGGF